jgi:small subunit ribosomal protein S6e
MVTFKAVIGTKDGKSVQKDIVDPQSNFFIGKSIGAKISGSDIGFEGYEFQLTGGSDACGFPMRREIPGTLRKKIFAASGVGLKKQGKGIRVRKTVCAGTIHDKISQINIKVLKTGKAPLVEAAPAATEEKKE